jgi:cell division protein FtsN
MLSKLKLLKYYSNLLVIISIFLVVSCNKNKSTELRFVNLAGKSKPIKFRVPEENAQILNNSKSVNLPNPNLNKETNQNSASKTTTEVAKNNPPIIPQNSLNTAFNKNEASNSDSSAVSNQYSDNQQQSSKTIAEQKYDFAENVANSLVPDLNLVNKQSIEEEMIIQGKYVNETKNIKEKEKILDKSKKNNLKSFKKAEKILDNTGEKQFYLQLASFNNKQNVADFIDKSKNKNLQTIEASLGNKTVYRAVLGPYQNRKIALKEMQKITKSGQEVVIIKN